MAWSSTAQALPRTEAGPSTGNGGAFGFTASDAAQAGTEGRHYYQPDQYNEIKEMLNRPGVLAQPRISDLEAGATTWALIDTSTTLAHARSMGASYGDPPPDASAQPQPPVEEGLGAQLTQFGSWVSSSVGFSAVIFCAIEIEQSSPVPLNIKRGVSRTR